VCTVRGLPRLGHALLTLVGVSLPSRLNVCGDERIFARVFDGNNVGPGDWQKNDLFLVCEGKPAGYFFVTANEDLPQPRFEVDEAAWAPDSRHLAFTAKLNDYHLGERGSTTLGEGIVVVDTKIRHSAPFLVACGCSPAWAPVASN
jgi:hypothetical protein